MSTNRINSPSAPAISVEGDAIAQLQLTSKVSEFLACDVIAKSAELFKETFDLDGTKSEPTEVLAGGPKDQDSRTAIKILMVGAYCLRAQEQGKTDLPLNEFIDQCLTAKYPATMMALKAAIPLCATEDRMMTVVSACAAAAGFSDESKMNTIAAALPFYSVACVMFDQQNGIAS